MHAGVRTLTVVLALLTLLTGCRSAAEHRGNAAPDCPGPSRCGGVWVRCPQPDFVPQGLALGPHGTAYLSGYVWKPHKGHRRCQVVRVDRTTGRVLAHVNLPECRHGGGLTLTRHGLWIAAARRLWLLDPAAIGHGDPVRRSWRVESPITASTVTSTPRGLVLATFAADREGRAYRFGYDHLLAPGATTLVDHGTAPGLVEARSATSSPTWVQGVGFGPGGLWFASSSTFCGALTTPSGRRLAFLPGAEGLDFDAGGNLWVVSESGAAPYQRDGDRPRVPTLSRIDRDALDEDVPPDCAWD
jgi:hypothetical protein